MIMNVAVQRRTISYFFVISNFRSNEKSLLVKNFFPFAILSPLAGPGQEMVKCNAFQKLCQLKKYSELSFKKLTFPMGLFPGESAE